MNKEFVPIRLYFTGNMSTSISVSIQLLKKKNFFNSASIFEIQDYEFELWAKFLLNLLNFDCVITLQ